MAGAFTFRSFPHTPRRFFFRPEFAWDPIFGLRKPRSPPPKPSSPRNKMSAARGVRWGVQVFGLAGVQQKPTAPALRPRFVSGPCGQLQPSTLFYPAPPACNTRLAFFRGFRRRRGNSRSMNAAAPVRSNSAHGRRNRRTTGRRGRSSGWK